MKKRCFGDSSPLYSEYHDTEWGIPSHDDRHLFEMLILEGAQAGLSWELILGKRAGYKKVFHNFDPTLVAAMTDRELEKLTLEPSIIRNRLKIFSTRKNARVFLEIQKEFGSFDAYLWPFVQGKPILNRWEKKEDVPSSSELSDRLAKDLKKRGMSFVGTTIIYSFMQAVGMINDHLVDCCCHNNI